MFGMDNQWNFLAWALLLKYMKESKKLFGKK